MLYRPFEFIEISMQNHEVISVTHQHWLFQGMSNPAILPRPIPNILPTPNILPSFVILPPLVILSEAKNLPLAHHLLPGMTTLITLTSPNILPSFVILPPLVILSEAKNLPLAHHRLHPMQRHIHQQRRKHTTLSNPLFAGEIGIAIHHSRPQPGINGMPEHRKGLQLIQYDCLGKVVERSFNISVEHKTGLTFNRYQNGGNRIMRAPARTITITMSFKSHLPFRFERQLHERLLTAIHHRQDSERTSFGRSWLGNPHPSHRSGRLVVPVFGGNGGCH